MQIRQTASWTARIVRRLRAFAFGPDDDSAGLGQRVILVAALAPIVPPVVDAPFTQGMAAAATVDIVQVAAFAPIAPPVVVLPGPEPAVPRARHSVSPLAIQLAATARLNVPVGRKPMAIGRPVSKAKPKPIARSEVKRAQTGRRVWLADRPVPVVKTTAEIIPMPTQRQEPAARPIADQRTVAA